MQTLAYVHTWAWWLPWLAAAVLVLRLNDAATPRAALLGWAYGCGWLLAGVWWLFISMHRYGGLPAPLAVLAVVALCSALSLYLAAAAALYVRWRSGHTVFDAVLFAALWMLAELARGVIFTGFPWLASGYSQVDGPLALLAPWLGVYGCGAVLAGLAAALAATLPGRRAVLRTLGWTALLAAVLAAGGWAMRAGALAPPAFTVSTGRLGVALLQPNVRQDEKFVAERLPDVLGWVGTALARADAALVIAPETAVPLLPAQLAELAPGYWAGLQATFSTPGRAALIGVPLGSFEAGYTNSVAGLSAATAAAGRDYRYDKLHLVPFGEFIPTGFRWFTDMMSIPLGDFARGVRNPPSFEVGAQRVAPNICYEDLFGEELARRFVDPARAPTIFANVGNIAWFGDTIAVTQHLQISRWRTLEFQLPMVRATNTGATAVIDHRGRVQAELRPFTQGVLVAEVEGRRGATPFARWSAHAGLWPPFGAALLVCALAAWRGEARRRRAAP